MVLGCHDILLTIESQDEAEPRFPWEFPEKWRKNAHEKSKKQKTRKITICGILGPRDGPGVAHSMHWYVRSSCITFFSFHNIFRRSHAKVLRTNDNYRTDHQLSDKWAGAILCVLSSVITKLINDGLSCNCSWSEELWHASAEFFLETVIHKCVEIRSIVCVVHCTGLPVMGSFTGNVRANPNRFLLHPPWLGTR